MKEFIKKNKNYLITVIVFLILLISIGIIFLLKKTYTPKSNYFTNTGINQEKVKETINFTKEKVKETISFTKKKEKNIIKLGKILSFPEGNQKIQYSGNILNYKLVEVNQLNELENLFKDTNSNSNSHEKLKNNQKYARIQYLSFNNNIKKIYFPNRQVVYSGCNIISSGDYINIKDLTHKICKIAIFPKLNKKYLYYNLEGPGYDNCNFGKNDVVILIIKANPKTYNLESYIKNIEIGNTFIKGISYKSLPNIFLANIPTKFKINGKIKNIKIYKIVQKTNISSKDLKEFGIKQEKSINAEKLLGKFGVNEKLIETTGYNVNYKSGVTIINFIHSQEGKHLLYFIGKYGYKYTVGYKVKKDFTEKDYKFKLDQNTFSFNVSSTFPFDEKNTEKNIKNFFKPYEVKFDWWSNREFKVTFYIPPKKLFSGSIIFDNVIKPIKQNIKIYIKNIPSKYTYAGIEGDTVNVLPKNGYRGHHISIGYKNFKKFDLYFQKCNLNPSINNKNTDIADLDLSVLKCKGKIIHKEFIDKNFKYWKEKWIDYKLPKEIENRSYFRVSFYKNFSQGTKYFKKTNLGITAKKTKKQYYIYVNNFDNGNFVNGGTASFYSFKNGKFQLKDVKAIVSGQAIFTGDGLNLVQIKKDNDQAYMFVYGDDWYRQDNYHSINIKSYINSSDIGQSHNDGNTNTVKIYGYTDRGLYKAGDTVFFAGWVRNLKNKSSIPKGKVVVKLTHYGNEISNIEIKNLDSFGGFKGKFTLPKSAELGFYNISFIYSDDVSYSQDIKVEEFQKPVFLSKNKLINQNGKIFLQINPQYYFGGNLKDYDLSVNWELKGKDICWDCRWRNNKTYYYNWVFKNSIYSGGDINLNNLKNKAVLKLIDLNKLKNLSYKITLKASITIKDNKTDEKHFYTEYFTVSPSILIGLKGQLIDRIYNSDVKNNKYKIEGKIENKKNIQGIKTYYAIYKRNFGYSEEKGVDGSYYYVNDTKFWTIKTGDLQLSNNNFDLSVPLTGEGEYFVRVRVEKDGKILGEVQKRFYYYDWSDDRGYYNEGYMGDHTNNIVLTVNVPKKEYKLNEKIPVNINPYIKGAKVLITVERGSNILDTYKLTLTGGKIQIPVKANYYPNVNISVAEFVGENNIDDSKGGKNDSKGGDSETSSEGQSSDNTESRLKKLKSSPDSKRSPEPRFYIGYAQADLSKDMVKLNIFIKTSKKEYKPGEKMKFTIYTLDANGNPVNARLSVAIVDKALADLYDLIKKPIPYFYNKLGSFIANLSTWKNLYVALKVFNSEGEKGGGGGGDGGGISSIRKKLYDLAFWRGGVYTKNGQITLQTTAPDNLTTWMIDVIGITKDIKLGTARAYFKTTKPLIVQPNLPTFITVGDSLKIPVSVITKKDLGKLGKIDLTVYKGLKNNGKINWKKIGTKQVKGNEKTYFDLKLGTDKFNYSKLYLKFIAKAQTAQDALQVNIPIRKKGFILHKFAFTGTKATNIKFNFENVAQKATYNLGISKSPVEAFTKALKYLLHYPYGCTEQLSSGLYPILVALDLNKNGIELGDIIKNNKINLGNYREGSRYVDIKLTVEETIGKIFRNQKDDGGLGYWPDEGESSNVILSSYVYGLLKNAQKQGFEVNKTKLSKLESYLDKIGNNPIAYLYYQWVKTSLGEKINVALFENIYNKNNNNLAIQVLAYAIYTNLGQTSKAQNIKINWNEKIDTQDRYWTFLNNNILKSIYLRAKLKQEEKITPEIQKIVMDLLGKRNSNGTWGRGTQKNVQILIALGEYMKKLNKNDKEFVCKVKINNITKELKFKRKTNLNLEFENIKSLKGTISCNESLLIEQKVDYVLKNLNKIKTELHNLTGVNWTYTGGNNVGATVSWDGTFTTLKKADKLAVEFYIPSNYKFLTTIGKQDSSEGTPFEVFGKYNYSGQTDYDGICKRNIDHYEVRFDRLFIYYNQLPANTTCRFRIKTIKAFEGKTHIMPVHIFEMYKTNVWGRKVLK